jgi:hypothetical protein
MSWPRITGIFIASMLVLVGVYDVIAIMGGGTEASISHMIIVWSYNYPAFTFAFGFVCGHLFWRVRSTPELDKMDKRTRE